MTIVHKQSLPLNSRYPDRWRNDVAKRMQKRGTRLVLDDSVENSEPKDGYIVTRKGVSIAADLVVSDAFDLLFLIVNVLRHVCRYPPLAQAQILHSSRSLSDLMFSLIMATSKSNPHSNLLSILVCLLWETSSSGRRRSRP